MGVDQYVTGEKSQYLFSVPNDMLNVKQNIFKKKGGRNFAHFGYTRGVGVGEINCHLKAHLFINSKYLS